MRPLPVRPARGFTLVELLTVIAIIALLIGILMPSLARARGQAKKVKVQSQLDAIGKGLEMFRNDQRDQYPISYRPTDPITNFPNANVPLQGAHLLTRALLGYDLRGVDYDFKMLNGPNTTVAELQAVERRPTYVQLESAKTIQDTQAAAQANGLMGTGAPETGRLIMLDGYGYPILYYQANPTGQGIADRRNVVGAIYYQEDNAMFTGGAGYTGWAFKNVQHDLANFGNRTNPDADPGSTFLKFFHNHDVHDASGVIAPYNSETFILLSAGEDGRYGTRDDVKNFKIGQ